MGNTVIQMRNDTAANWTSNNPTLAQGEMGLETDTNRIKFGDGSTAWNSLPYFNSSFKYGLYTLSANQTSNLTTGNHIEFDTLAGGSLNSPSTGSGQAKGIITLPAGKTYKLSATVQCIGTSNGDRIDLKFYNRTNSSFLAFASNNMATGNTDHYLIQPLAFTIISATTNIDIDLRISYAAGNLTLYKDFSWLLIEEYGGY